GSDVCSSDLLGLMGLTVSGPSLWGLSLTLLVWAIGVGVLMPAIVAAAMHALPERPGFASGAGSTARNLGGAVGVAVSAALHQIDTAVLMAAAGVAMVAAAFICLRVQLGTAQGSAGVPQQPAGRLTSAGHESNGPRSRSRSRLSD